MNTRVSVENFKNLVVDLYEEESWPTNPVVIFDEGFNIELTSDLYDNSDKYELGRADDLLDFLGVDTDESITKNLNRVNIDSARWLTCQLKEIIATVDYENADY